jgi:hypothetical protein
MDRERRIELIQRSLGLKHKLKVHESMKMPDTHEDLAVMIHARWELEDELRAIEEVLAGVRNDTVAERKRAIVQENAPVLKKKTRRA